MVRRVPLRGWLLAVLVLMIGFSAIMGPYVPQDFIIEHILTSIGLILLLIADRAKPISRASSIMLFIFLALHILGAHYTYSLVPYQEWARSIFGDSVPGFLATERNHYDRLVHLTFGLLLVYPMRELLARALPEIRDGRLVLIAVLVIAVVSKLYEVLEWLFTLVMTKEAAAVYNGEQGDIRDAHKDMTLALCGSLVSGVVIWLWDRRRGGYRPAE